MKAAFADGDPAALATIVNGSLTMKMDAKSRRAAERKDAEELLIRGFPVFVNAFTRNPAFAKPAQLATHVKTIELRRELGSADAAVSSQRFVEFLCDTLRAWGIGMRGSHLLDGGEICESLEKNRTEIIALDGVHLDDPNMNVAEISSRVWRLIRSVRIVNNKATLVPSTKALHHLLPDLVVPMDRAYTRPFFGWHEPEFQNRQAECFDYAFGAFHRVAQAANPRQYVGEGWNSSLSKVIDNAVVGVFVLGKSFIESQRSAG